MRTRVLALVLCLSSMAGAARSQDALTTEVIRRIRGAYPGAQVQVEPGDALTVRVDGKAVRTELANLRAICTRTPEHCEAAMQARVSFSAGLDLPAFSLQQVRAVVRPVEYLQAVLRQFDDSRQTSPVPPGPRGGMPFSQPLGSGLVRMWVLDSPHAMALVSVDMVERENVTVAALDEASRLNFTGERMPVLVPTSIHPALWIAHGNDYLSSVLLDEELWRRVAGEMAGQEGVVCFPERHRLIAYFPQLDPRGEVLPAVLCGRAASLVAVSFSAEPIRRFGENWIFR